MVRRWSRKQTTDEIRQTPDEIKKKPRRDKANPRRDKTNPRRQDQVYRGCTQRRDCGDTIHAQGWRENSGLHKRHHTETVGELRGPQNIAISSRSRKHDLTFDENPSNEIWDFPLSDSFFVKFEIITHAKWSAAVVN